MNGPDDPSACSEPAATPRTDAALAWVREADARVELIDEVRRQVRRRRQRRNVVGMSAVLIGALAMGFTWTMRSTHDDAPVAVVAPASAPTLTWPREQTLPDGTVVALKGDATIAVDFSGPLRRVTLQSGEAHFQVAKDPTRPFVVTAGRVEVRAVGTAFSVELATAAVEVLVTEGRVAVEQEHAAVPAAVNASAPLPGVDAVAVTPPPALLDAGHRASIPLVGEMAQIVPVAADEIATRLAWRVPQLEFSHTPLADVLPVMNAHAVAHGKRPLIVDPPSSDLGAVRLSGFLAADNTDGLATLLRSNFGVQVETTANAIVVRKRP